MVVMFNIPKVNILNYAVMKGFKKINKLLIKRLRYEKQIIFNTFASATKWVYCEIRH